MSHLKSPETIVLQGFISTDYRNIEMAKTSQIAAQDDAEKSPKLLTAELFLSESAEVSSVTSNKQLPALCYLAW